MLSSMYHSGSWKRERQRGRDLNEGNSYMAAMTFNYSTLKLNVRTKLECVPGNVLMALV